MRSKVVKLLLKKELLDVFRDRKAVIMLVLVPILIYPLIFFGAFAVMTMIQSNMEQGEYKIMLDVDDDGELESRLEAYGEKESEKSSSTDASKTEKLSVVTYDDYISSEKIDTTGKSQDDMVNEFLQKEEIDVYVTTEADSNGKLTYKSKYVSSITDSNYGETVVNKVLGQMSADQMKATIEEAGLDAEDVTHPFKIDRKDIASKEQSAGSLLGMILPFMLIVSLLMGTMYPAIDTTAGEKERGTLETLLTLPVRNTEIIIAKFLTVAFMGIISALLNILSMAVMIIYVLKLMQSKMASSMGFDISNFHVSTFVPAMIVTVLAVLAFSLFISAITMCVSAFAKSYKEANNYITPLTLIVMLTGYIGFIPNINLTNKMAMVPVANICLLVKEMLLFKADMGVVAIVLLTNVLYAGIAIMFLGKIYNSESVLFDEGRSNLQLFEKRSNMVKGGVPTSGDAWFLVFFGMIAYLYVGSMFQMNYGIMGILYSQLLILALPLVYVIYTKKSIRKTYSFNGFRPLKFLGALIFFIGVLLAENIFTSLMYELFPEQLDSMNQGMAETLMGDNFLVSILIIALAPAICEEMMFRGFIFSGFRSRYKIVASVIMVSLIFGIYHTSLIRLVPTAMLGAGFAVIVYYTGSIFPSMVMHFLNNSMAVIAMYYPGVLEDTFPLIFSEDMTILGSFIVGAISVIMIAGGVTIMRKLK